MAFSEFELKKIEKEVCTFINERRPPPAVRSKVDLNYRIQGQSLELFEIRPLWNDPNKMIETPFAKATFVKSQKIWKIYWQRTDLKWHRYEPNPEVRSPQAFLDVVNRDESARFFG